MTLPSFNQQDMVLDKKDIVIITDFEEGHIYPLFGIARNLEEAGYSTCFVCIIDALDIIKKNGFDGIPILEKLCPRGYVKNLKDNGISNNSISPNLYMQLIFEELDRFMPLVQPKIVFTSCFFGLGTLIIHYKYKVHQINFHTLFPPLSDKSSISMSQGSANCATYTFNELNDPITSFFINFFKGKNPTFKNHEDFLGPLKEIPQIMLCPKQLNIIGSEPTENEVFLGPCINSVDNLQTDFFQEVLEKKGCRKIIYLSMGSQTKEYSKKVENVFNTVLEAMKSEYFKDFYLILSLGSNSKNLNLVEPPENADIFSWVPQLEMLKLASVAIIHGGLGSIKECIYFGVPMLIVPMGRDQPDNAMRIEHHQIGYTLSIDVFTKEIVAEKVLELLQNQQRRENLLKMQNIFQKIEKQKNEVKLVQSLLNKTVD